MTINAQKNLKYPVIVCNSWGDYLVFPATIEFVKKLLIEKISSFGEEAFPGMEVLKTRKAFADSPDDISVPYLVSSTLVLEAMKELLFSGEGHESRALYRLSETGPLNKGSRRKVTKLEQNEMVLWAFHNKIDVKTAIATDLQRTRPEKDLHFLGGLVFRANGHPVKYCDESTLREADELQVLLHGTWKPTATLENVVQRYLTLINACSHRDEEYRLGVMEAPPGVGFVAGQTPAPESPDVPHE